MYKIPVQQMIGNQALEWGGDQMPLAREGGGLYLDICAPCRVPHIPSYATAE